MRGSLQIWGLLQSAAYRMSFLKKIILKIKKNIMFRFSIKVVSESSAKFVA